MLLQFVSLNANNIVDFLSQYVPLTEEFNSSVACLGFFLYCSKKIIDGEFPPKASIALFFGALISVSVSFYFVCKYLEEMHGYMSPLLLCIPFSAWLWWYSGSIGHRTKRI